MYAAKGTGSGNAELWTLVCREECSWQREVEELEAAEGFEFREIAGGPMLCSGQESVTSAVRRRPSQLGGVPEPGRLGAATGSPSTMDSTWAA